MLSILYPEVLKDIQSFPVGLLPFFNRKTNEYILVIKVTKETILTAKINGSFKIYVMDSGLGDNVCYALVSAFFDDHDEPLVVMTPLFSQEPIADGLRATFGERHFDVYFFDESNRELLGVRADNIDFERFSTTLQGLTFLEFKNQNLMDIWKKIQYQFGTRTAKDDEAAFTINIKETLYPDDFAIIDTSTEFHGANESNLFSTLERTEPGAMQEFDIALLLRRVFPADCIYLNPYRADSQRELCDVLVVDDDFIIFLQAKDSPNTDQMLRRTNNRKRATIRFHIAKAVAQLQGALAHTIKNEGFTIILDQKDVRIELKNRQMIGLIIVKEIFDDEYSECSDPVLDLVRAQNLPVILLEFLALHTLTHHLKFPTSFVVHGLYKILDAALENNEFSKPVWAPPPQEL